MPHKGFLSPLDKREFRKGQLQSIPHPTMQSHDQLCSLFDGCWCLWCGKGGNGQLHLWLMKEFRSFDVIPILCLKRIESFLLCKLQELFSAVLDLLKSFLLCSWLPQWDFFSQFARKKSNGGWGLYSIEKSLLQEMLSWWVSWIHRVSTSSLHRPEYFINCEESRWKERNPA